MDRETGVSATQAELSKKIPLLTSEWDLRAMRQTAVPMRRWRAFQPEGTASGKAQGHERAWWPSKEASAAVQKQQEGGQRGEPAQRVSRAWLEGLETLERKSERNGTTLESLWHWTGMMRSHFGFSKHHVDCCVEKAKGQGQKQEDQLGGYCKRPGDGWGWLL